MRRQVLIRLSNTRDLFGQRFRCRICRTVDNVKSLSQQCRDSSRELGVNSWHEGHDLVALGIAFAIPACGQATARDMALASCRGSSDSLSKIR